MNRPYDDVLTMGGELSDELNLQEIVGRTVASVQLDDIGDAAIITCTDGFRLGIAGDYSSLLIIRSQEEE